MKEVDEHQKGTANDTGTIRAMTQNFYFEDGAYFNDMAKEWEQICNQKVQDELEKQFGGKKVEVLDEK